MNSPALTPGAIQGRRVVERIARVFGCALEDWNQMIGFESEVRDVRLGAISGAAQVAQVLSDGLRVRTMAIGAAEAPIVMVFDTAFLGQAVRQAMMLPEQAKARLDVGDEQQLEAAKELMNLFCGSATKALEGFVPLRLSQSVDDLCLDTGSPETFRIPPLNNLFGVRVDLGWGEFRGRAWCLMPNEVVQVLGGETELPQAG